MTAVAELPSALNADAIATACEVLNAAVALPVEQYESNPALRPLRQAIVAGGSVVVVGVVHRVLAHNLLETFIARPLIWLIMT